jgi:hypothetical protein
MSYHHFTLEKIKNDFQLTIIEKNDLFKNIPQIKVSDFLKETLKYNIPLAIAHNTEKSRSELIVSPILLEAHKQQKKFSFFSGVKFNVDRKKGLAGFCDFIISRSEEMLFITAPVVMLVEAKNDNIKSGLGQCVAEMIAAQIFNNQENNAITSIFGVVTTGTNWQFLKLTDKTVEIDLTEYYLHDIEKIIGFLTFPCQSLENNLQAA